MVIRRPSGTSFTSSTWRRCETANKAAAEEYEIGGFPMVVFLRAQGEVIGQMGYEQGGQKPWIQKAQELLNKK